MYTYHAERRQNVNCRHNIRDHADNRHLSEEFLLSALQKAMQGQIIQLQWLLVLSEQLHKYFQQVESEHQLYVVRKELSSLWALMRYDYQNAEHGNANDYAAFFGMLDKYHDDSSHLQEDHIQQNIVLFFCF